MTEVQTEVQKLTNNKEIIAYLAEKFPLCFSLEGEAKPLKIGLFQDLAEALADDEKVSKTQLRQALRQYTSNWRYLHGCKVGAQRVDLAGNPCGALEQEHADHAAKQLAEAKAKVAEKRAAEKAANPNANKKRPARPAAENKTEGKKKAFAGKQQRKPKADFVAVDMESLAKGSKVKVKVGDKAKNAVVLENTKDSARVELDNGLVITVSADRLFA
ncbi:RNA chaperone ProQ [Caviibacterium pharyngocola]|uniref:RNA chaperone ProQ n=1 Tax=Caviibacterium pharyngocola TaxID=28159 RepID=A0A2M8RW53_9PAST|nr:RNA chaperone ProQ [Caviibacterium pharyngocola]PJG83109.1 RNA chaperone ProQ [Caviibacterium pharyngocola]